MTTPVQVLCCTEDQIAYQPTERAYSGPICQQHCQYGMRSSKDHTLYYNQQSVVCIVGLPTNLTEKGFINFLLKSEQVMSQHVTSAPMSIRAIEWSVYHIT